MGALSSRPNRNSRIEKGGGGGEAADGEPDLGAPRETPSTLTLIFSSSSRTRRRVLPVGPVSSTWADQSRTSTSGEKVDCKREFEGARMRGNRGRGACVEVAGAEPVDLKYESLRPPVLSRVSVRAKRVARSPRWRPVSQQLRNSLTTARRPSSSFPQPTLFALPCCIFAISSQAPRSSNGPTEGERKTRV